MDKKDYFGATASHYEKFRPSYSTHMLTDIFKIMSELQAQHKLYMDVACGTGQLLLPLGKSFDRAIGVDLSEKQIYQAKQKVSDPKYTLKAMDCQDLDTVMDVVKAQPPFNLITIGQGLHWFKIHEFITQVQTMVEPNNGIFAVLGYSAFEFDPEDGKVEAILSPLFKEYMSQLLLYFDCDRAILEDKYAHFKFDNYFTYVKRIMYPDKLTDYRMETFFNYLTTMSSLGPFKEAKGYDALQQFRAQLFDVLKEEGLITNEQQFLRLKIKAIVPYYSILMWKPKI